MVNKDGAAVLLRRMLIKGLMLLVLFKLKLRWTTVGMSEKKRQLRVML